MTLSGDTITPTFSISASNVYLTVVHTSKPSRTFSQSFAFYCPVARSLPLIAVCVSRQVANFRSPFPARASRTCQELTKRYASNLRTNKAKATHQQKNEWLVVALGGSYGVAPATKTKQNQQNETNESDLENRSCLLTPLAHWRDPLEINERLVALFGWCTVNHFRCLSNCLADKLATRIIPLFCWRRWSKKTESEIGVELYDRVCPLGTANGSWRDSHQSVSAIQQCGSITASLLKTWKSYVTCSPACL